MKHSWRLIAFLFLLAWPHTLSSQSRQIPDLGTANIWYHYTDSETALVFVHGFLSNIRDSWLYENRRGSSQAVFWPELIASDPIFNNTAIFLGGYYTATNSGNYDIHQSAMDLADALSRTDEAGHRVLDKRNIIFIAHSTGGIVVRQMLVKNQQRFVDKNIGLILMASPSLGSYWADRADIISRSYHNQTAQQLRRGSAFLTQLDNDFRELLDNGLLRIMGIERCENHFIIERLVLPDSRLVVSPESCARYFGPARILPQTNHFTAVKPDTRAHPAYLAVRDFYTGRWKNFVAQNPPAELNVKIEIQPRVVVRRDTIISWIGDIFPQDCSADSSDISQYTLPQGWKLSSAPILRVVEQRGTGTDIIWSLNGETFRVQARVRGAGYDAGGECIAQGRALYTVTLAGYLLDEVMLSIHSPEPVLLTRTRPEATFQYPLPDDVIVVRWDFHARVEGSIGRRDLSLYLTNLVSEAAGVRAVIDSHGKLLIDGRPALYQNP